MKEKILVTGGAGFIGSSVVDRLVREGFMVSVADNLSTGRKENLNPEAAFYNVDICDRNEINKILKEVKPRYVNHHAAQIDVRKSVDNPGFDAMTNIVGSVNLIDLSQKNGVEKFVYISTGGAVYGEPETLPASEDSPVRPISAYGISKHTAEHYLHLYSHLYGMRYTVLRYANVYGPRQDPKGEAGVIAIFTDKMSSGKAPCIFGSGEQTRDYVYVEDIVDANMLALGRGDGEIFNIGTGVETSVNSIFKMIAGLLGFKGSAVYENPRRGEVDRIFLDNSKAISKLGWRVTHDLAAGMAKTADYYKRK